ncbi:MAG TPA: hypothetical protein VFB99_06925 [Vicinamibacterales bacterium]|nr:hypothetical protein [Vicinamibacterales bacterium]
MTTPDKPAVGAGCVRHPLDAHPDLDALLEPPPRVVTTCIPLRFEDEKAEDLDTEGPFRLDGGPDGRSRLDVTPLGSRGED